MLVKDIPQFLEVTDTRKLAFQIDLLACIQVVIAGFTEAGDVETDTSVHTTMATIGGKRRPNDSSLLQMSRTSRRNRRYIGI